MMRFLCGDTRPVERYVIAPLVILLLAALLWQIDECVIGEQDRTYIGMRQAFADSWRTSE